MVNSKKTVLKYSSHRIDDNTIEFIFSEVIPREDITEENKGITDETYDKPIGKPITIRVKYEKGQIKITKRKIGRSWLKGFVAVTSSLLWMPVFVISVPIGCLGFVIHFTLGEIYVLLRLIKRRQSR